MKYLIITADDLGLTKSINEGIARAYQDGIVKSISAIPTGEAFEDALKVMKDLKLEEIGAHLSLTETKPLLASSKFYKDHNRLFFELSLGRISADCIYSELKAQLDLLRSSGIRITHINSHEHIHMIPEVLAIFVKLAKEYGIPAIRYPGGDRPPMIFSPSEIYRYLIISYFAKKTKNIVIDSGLLYTDFFFGLLDGGRLNEESVVEILNNLKHGVTELVCHPGFLSPEVLDHYSWHRGAERELFVLTDKKTRKAVESNGIKLITYREFLSMKR